MNPNGAGTGCDPVFSEFDSRHLPQLEDMLQTCRLYRALRLISVTKAPD